MVEQPPSPLRLECGLVMGEYDEINGPGAQEKQAIVTIHELEILCHHWAEIVADCKAERDVWGFSGSWEIRAEPYGRARLDYFAGLLGAEKVREILSETTLEAIARKSAGLTPIELENEQQELTLDDLLEKAWIHLDDGNDYLDGWESGAKVIGRMLYGGLEGGQEPCEALRKALFFVARWVQRKAEDQAMEANAIQVD